MRIFNRSNSEASGELSTFWKVEKAWLCNSSEEALEELTLRKGKILVHASGRQILTLRLRFSRKKRLNSKARAYRIPQSIQEKEAWLEVKAPPIITARDLAREKMRIKKARKKFEMAKRKVESLEKKYKISKEAIDKYELEKSRLEMYKLAENLQDAEYSFLLCKKKYVRSIEKDPESVRKKTRSIQRKIDRMASTLIEPRARRQSQEFVVRACQRMLQKTI